MNKILKTIVNNIPLILFFIFLNFIQMINRIILMLVFHELTVHSFIKIINNNNIYQIKFVRIAEFRQDFGQV